MSHEIPVLRELVVLAGVSLVVLLLFQRLRLPAVIGFMVTGVLIGPGGFGLIGDIELVRTLAEFGVVLLLFMVGLEFSLADVRRLGRIALVGGGLQVGLTIVIVAVFLLAAGQHPARAIFFGMLVALSSTAVVFKLLSDRVELSSPIGRGTTAVLIFQDLIAIVFLLAIPFLDRWQQGGAAAGPSLGGVMNSLAVIVGVALVLAWARRLIPWILGRASRTGSSETFLFGAALVALGAAYLASRLGASLALGAFLAGLILAESELRTQIAAEVLPFRDALASIFFVAIGMSLDPRVLIEYPVLVLASTVGLVTVKLATGFLAMLATGTSLRIALGVGLTLAQMGEFSFILVQSAEPTNLLGPAGAQAFTAGAVFSLILTPFLVANAGAWSLKLDLRYGFLWAPVRKAQPLLSEDDAPQSELQGDHVVVAGAGLNGQNVARVLRAVRIPHVVVDLNPDNLEPLRAEGSPVLVGDVTKALVLRQAGIVRARAMVIGLSDSLATRHGCRLARGLSSDLFIVVRTRHIDEIDGLYAMGANQVIPEEFETSIEIFTSVLRELHVPNNVIDAQILLLRHEHYSILRGRKLPRPVIEQLDTILQEGTTDTFLLLQESPAVGQTLGDLGLLGDGAGARVVAVVRGGRAMTRIDQGYQLRVGDTLVLTGTHAEMDRTFRALSRSGESHD